MTTSFYAYIHATPDGTPFYVGKGRGARWKLFGKDGARSTWHTRITVKHSRENILVGKLDCSTESIAFDLERGLIKCLRRMGVKLCNLTDGGEGWSGASHTEDARIRIAKALSGRKRPPHVGEAVRNARLGKKQTPAHLAARSAGMKGHVVAEETRRLIGKKRIALAQKKRELLAATLPAGTKLCSLCKEAKDKGAFGPAKKASDGLSCQCRSCAAASAREKRRAKRGSV